MANRCIYCGSEANGPSTEHIISAALGCKETLPFGICKPCNDAFGHDIEGPFVNSLVLFRSFFRIPNRDGRVPDLKLIGHLDGSADQFAVTLTGDGRVLVSPRPIRSENTEEGIEKEFRIFAKQQESIIEANLRTKHGDLIWRQLTDTKTLQNLNVQAQFDATALSSPEALRTVAKFALNLLAYQHGVGFATEKLEDLKKFIHDGRATAARIGLIGSEPLLQTMPFAPPKHLFIMFSDGSLHRATVFIWLFSMFPYAVVVEEPAILIDSFRSVAIDPYTGRFCPLLVGAPPVPLSSIAAQFPLPELALAQLIENEDLTKQENSIRVARRALAFIEKVRSREGVGTAHVCYRCGRVLDVIPTTCPYCGRSPLPTP